MSPCPPRSMGDLELSSCTDTHPTESDLSDDDSDDDFRYDFPQPPPISPILRRMRSSPWYSHQLETMAKPERRHSASPIVQHPDSWPHSLLRHDTEPSNAMGRNIRRDQESNLELTGGSLVAHRSPERPHEHVTKSPQLPKPLLYRDPFFPRRTEHLPPPAPAPSIPLPRLPRIIRKVASMRSESRQDLSMVSSRRPVPKIKSLKFLSGSMLGSSAPQSYRQGERKRSWSLSRPTSYQKPKPAPIPDAPYLSLNSTNDQLSGVASSSWALPVYASSPVYSNPYLPGDNIERHTNNIAFSPEGRFDLSRGSTSLAPPFTQRAARSGMNVFHRYSNSCYGEGTLFGSGVSACKTGSIISHERSKSGQHPPHYSVNNGVPGKNASSGTLLQGAKSFINITPERQKSKRGRSKSAGGSTGPGNERGSVGHHVGSTMKEKGEKVKRLFARASSGVVDWGRQLAGRPAKSATASSTSGSLAPLASGL